MTELGGVGVMFESSEIGGSEELVLVNSALMRFSVVKRSDKVEAKSKTDWRRLPAFLGCSLQIS